MTEASERAGGPTDVSRASAGGCPSPPVAAALALDQPADDPHQLGGLEGLGEEDVDPGGVPALDLLLRTGTDDRDGQVPRLRIGTQLGDRPEPVEPRHDHVERDHVGAHPVHDVQTLGTIVRGHHLEASSSRLTLISCRMTLLSSTTRTRPETPGTTRE
ncbi:hypothetical protein SF23_03160 [Streptomyces sp. MBRL 10]|nr:hypothetical protein SF23_03160 [Streptomyces sp. MBRL 10]